MGRNELDGVPLSDKIATTKVTQELRIALSAEELTRIRGVFIQKTLAGITSL